MNVDVMRGASGAAWVVWEPLTTGDLLTVGLRAVLGLAALTLAAVGLWQMRAASVARNRQLDAMLTMLDERTAALTRGLETATSMLDERTAALSRGLETVIRQTASGGRA